MAVEDCHQTSLALFSKLSKPSSLALMRSSLLTSLVALLLNSPACQQLSCTVKIKTRRSCSDAASPVPNKGP